MKHKLRLSHDQAKPSLWYSLTCGASSVEKYNVFHLKMITGMAKI